MLVKDKDSNAIFDDWVHDNKEDGDTDETYTDTWTQVCDKCAKEHHLLDSYLTIGEAPPESVCGVKGCNNGADHYYDFNRIEVEKE